MPLDIRARKPSVQVRQEVAFCESVKAITEGNNLCVFRYKCEEFWRVAVISAKTHKRQRRKRQSVTAKREKSQTPKVLTAILTLPNLT